MNSLKVRVAAPAAALLAAMLIAAPAQAASIPKGAYACSNSNGFALGVVHIKSKNRYDVNGGKKYPYKYSRGTRIVTFRKGDYKSFFGAYSKKTIDIYETKSGDYLWSCYR